MIVTTLGTSSPYPRPDDPCSSFLLEDAGTRLWIDAGPGSLAALQAHCRLEDLDAIWISHTHADHFSDLAATSYALMYADISRPPLTVFGPPGWAERLRAFLTHTETPSPIEDAFDIREVSDRVSATVDRLELTAVKVQHDVPCYALRVRQGSCVVAYTGDTGPCQALGVLATDAQILISEAGYGVDADDPEPVHLTAAQAGTVAKDNGVQQLLLTHLAGADVDTCVAAATATASGTVIGARPGLAVEA